PADAAAWAAGAVGFVRGAGEWWLAHRDRPDVPDREQLTERAAAWLWAGPAGVLSHRPAVRPPAARPAPTAPPPHPARPHPGRPRRAATPPDPTSTARCTGPPPQTSRRPHDRHVRPSRPRAALDERRRRGVDVRGPRRRRVPVDAPPRPLGRPARERPRDRR